MDPESKPKALTISKSSSDFVSSRASSTPLPERVDFYEIRIKELEGKISKLERLEEKIDKGAKEYYESTKEIKQTSRFVTFVTFSVLIVFVFSFCSICFEYLKRDNALDMYSNKLNIFEKRLSNLEKK